VSVAEELPVAFERICDRIRDDADSRDPPQIAMHDYPDRAQFGEICGKEPREARIFVAEAARRDADSDSGRQSPRAEHTGCC
jgi:hypothetical protein